MSSFPSDSTVEFDLTVDERLLVLSVDVLKRPSSVPIDALTVVLTEVLTAVPKCPMFVDVAVVTKRPMFEYLTAVPRRPLSDDLTVERSLFEIPTVERVLSDSTAVERCL